MSSLRENRLNLLEAHALNVIDDEDFLLLYDLNTSKNPDLPYWNYKMFALDDMTDDDDDECLTEFRFLKIDIYALSELLNIPEEIKFMV